MIKLDWPLMLADVRYANAIVRKHNARAEYDDEAKIFSEAWKQLKEAKHRSRRDPDVRPGVMEVERVYDEAWERLRKASRKSGEASGEELDAAHHFHRLKKGKR